MTRKVQCKACPWRKATAPGTDIPGGYEAEKHRALIRCQAPGLDALLSGGPIRAMACHESRPDADRECVGWLVNQLGPGNNLALRFRARSGEYNDLQVIGEQHESLEAMVATAGRRRRRKR